MQRAAAIDKLKPFETRLRALGATSLYLFGSTARDEATATSDLDLFLDLARETRFSLLDLVEAKLMIEDELGATVDVTTRGGLHRWLRDAIEREAIRIF